jgi:hypothetical protein
VSVLFAALELHLHAPMLRYRMNVREMYGPRNHDIPLEYIWSLPDESIVLNQEEATVFGSYWSRL